MPMLIPLPPFRFLSGIDIYEHMNSRSMAELDAALDRMAKLVVPLLERDRKGALMHALRSAGGVQPPNLRFHV